MKKTHIHLLASLIAVGALGTLAITSNAAPAFVSGVDASHHITFTGANLVSHSYNENTYYHTFTIGDDKAIDNTYSLYSYDGTWDFGTNIYGTEEEVVYSESENIFHIPSVNSNRIQVVFALIDRANLDLDKSKVTYTNSNIGHESALYFIDVATKMVTPITGPSLNSMTLMERTSR